jgi:hypothetical protein
MRRSTGRLIQIIRVPSLDHDVSGARSFRRRYFEIKNCILDYNQGYMGERNRCHNDALPPIDRMPREPWRSRLLY